MDHPVRSLPDAALRGRGGVPERAGVEQGLRADDRRLADGERSVAIDEHFDTGPIGDILQAGPNQIDAAPFPMPTIWLLPESLSPTAGIKGTGDGFGPVRVGMTLDEASTALGLELEVLGEVPYHWLAGVSDDPYSPSFLADGPGDGTSVIVEIHLLGQLLLDVAALEETVRNRIDALASRQTFRQHHRGHHRRPDAPARQRSDASRRKAISAGEPGNGPRVENDRSHQAPGAFWRWP